MSASSLKISVQSTDEGLRLDQFLTGHFPDYSRNQLIAAIRDGVVFVDGLCKKSSYRLKPGEQVVVDKIPSSSPPPSLIPEKIDFPILYEDEHLLVLVKPPGLVVHPGSGNYEKTLVHGLLYHCGELACVRELCIALIRTPPG